jgi:hypothetical protein
LPPVALLPPLPPVELPPVAPFPPVDPESPPSSSSPQAVTAPSAAPETRQTIQALPKTLLRVPISTNLLEVKINFKKLTLWWGTHQRHLGIT